MLDTHTLPLLNIRAHCLHVSKSNPWHTGQLEHNSPCLGYQFFSDLKGESPYANCLGFKCKTNPELCTEIVWNCTVLRSQANYCVKRQLNSSTQECFFFAVYWHTYIYHDQPEYKTMLEHQMPFKGTCQLFILQYEFPYPYRLSFVISKHSTIF